MVNGTAALQAILQDFTELAEKLRETADPAARLGLLRQMCMLLGDADKIIGSEMGED
jgi:hypothetical protein